MRFRQLILGIIFLISSSFSYAIDFVGQTPKVLPLGDSITSGRFEPSYRHKLKLLTDASSTVNLDFIGTLDSLSPPAGFTDDEHEGWSGRTANDILNEVHPDSTTGQGILDHALATLETPDIALIHLGTNNFLFTFDGINLDSLITTATNNLTAIVAKLRAKNPNMVIMLAQIIPIATDAPNTIPGFESGAPNIPPYNVAIAQLASNLNTTNSPVIVVDQFTGFDQSTDLLTDGIHPTISGEQKIAQKWFDALEPFFTSSSNADAGWTLNENSGTLAQDQSSNNIDLTLNNGASWVPGQSGSAIELNGSNQDASTSSGATAIQTPSVTLSAWIYPDSTSASWEWVASQADNFGIYLTPNSGRVAFYIKDSSGGWTDVFSSNSSIQFNQWQHVAGTFDASSNTMKVYVNGIEVGSSPFGQGIQYDTGNGFTIGSMQNQRFFDGKIDEVQVFGSALTQTEISDLMNFGGDIFPPVITPNGVNPVTIQVNDTYTDAGATAVDAIDGSVTVNVDQSAVDTSMAGTYYVYFTATDSAGNTAYVARSVVVTEAMQTIPAITSPVEGSTLSGSSQTFTWQANNTDVTEWWLHIGTSTGAFDIYNSGTLGLSNSDTVNNLPTDGSTLFVRLWYKENGAWKSVDTTYVADDSSNVMIPAITSPVAGATLSGTSQTFTWQDNGTNVTEWWLYVGTSAGAKDIYDSGTLALATSDTVNNLPTNGSTLFVRLWYRENGAWKSVDTTYIADDSSNVMIPAITSPVAGATLSGTSQTFTWQDNGTNVTEWWLYVGTSAGARDIYDSGTLALATSDTVNNLPTNGSTLFVRLWYRENGAWESADFTYTAFTAMQGSSPAAYWSLDENQGTVANDSSSNAINLTLNNGATWVTGQTGSALELNGTNQDASTSSATILQTQSVTLSAWVYPDSTTVSWEWVAAQADNYGIFITPNDGRVSFYVHDTNGGWTNISSANNAVQFNQWQHIAGSFDDATNTMKLYVNGIEVGSNTLAQGITYDTGNGFTIGSMSSSRFFDGKIDEVRAYNTALTQSEIAQLAGNTNNVSTTQILPLGDSITDSFGGRPSYRRPLWNLLQNAGYNVDFVGSNTFNGSTYTDFDQDHEGHSGDEAGDIDRDLNGYLTNVFPDIVLLHIGTNDLDRGQTDQTTLDEIDSIIQKLRTKNPNVKILLAKIIPMRYYDTASFNAQIDGFVATRTTSSSPILVVDQYTGYDAQNDNYDNFHPNESGENKIANKWFTTLQSLL